MLLIYLISADITYTNKRYLCDIGHFGMWKQDLIFTNLGCRMFYYMNAVPVKCNPVLKCHFPMSQFVPPTSHPDTHVRIFSSVGSNFHPCTSLK